jgi:hypothetical protein
VEHTAHSRPHPVHPLAVMQTLPMPCALQSASSTQRPASAQNTSSAHMFLPWVSSKHHEPSPTSLLHLPQPVKPDVQFPSGER